MQTSLAASTAEQLEPVLLRPLARFELLLNAVVGFVWGPMLFHFARHVVVWEQIGAFAACLALTIGLGFAGGRAPASWFRLRRWEQAGRGRVYEHRFLIRSFKRWMSDGDWMNAWLRRRVPAYRVVAPTRASAASYAGRTLRIERAHLAWLLGALGPAAYALLVEAYGFCALWMLANVITNVWPILLQRYNRVRAEAVSRRPRVNAVGGQASAREVQFHHHKERS